MAKDKWCLLQPFPGKLALILLNISPVGVKEIGSLLLLAPMSLVATTMTTYVVPASSVGFSKSNCVSVSNKKKLSGGKSELEVMILALQMRR